MIRLLVLFLSVAFSSLAFGSFAEVSNKDEQIKLMDNVQASLKPAYPSTCFFIDGNLGFTVDIFSKAYATAREAFNAHMNGECSEIETRYYGAATNERFFYDNTSHTVIISADMRPVESSKYFAKFIFNEEMTKVISATFTSLSMSASCPLE